MFPRVKRRKGIAYYVLVENHRKQGQHRQRTVHNFGRLDRLDPKKVNEILRQYDEFAFLR